MLGAIIVAPYPADFLDISPRHAAQLAVINGAIVRLLSPHRLAPLPGRINAAVKPGELFTPFHTAQGFLNNLKNFYRDKQTMAPEYKVTALRIENRQ